MAGGHVVDFMEHTTYSSTIKDVSVRLMVLIAVKNGLGLMDGDIVNALCTGPCAEMFSPDVVRSLVLDVVQ